MYVKQGEYEKAEELYEKSLRIYKKVFWEKHFNTIAGHVNLAMMYVEQRKYDKAKELNEKNLQICKEVLDDEHPITANNFIIWDDYMPDKMNMRML